MGNYRIKILQIAQDDMKSIIAYIRLDDPDAAMRMVEKITSAIGNLTDYPLMGAVPRDKKIAEQGYRMIIVEPCLIFYIVITEDKTVEIHRVIHGMRDYSNIV
jgi:plasmid stabilization system protein ParE